MVLVRVLTCSQHVTGTNNAITSLRVVDFFHLFLSTTVSYKPFLYFSYKGKRLSLPKSQRPSNFAPTTKLTRVTITSCCAVSKNAILLQTIQFQGERAADIKVHRLSGCQCWKLNTLLHIVI